LTGEKDNPIGQIEDPFSIVRLGDKGFVIALDEFASSIAPAASMFCDKKMTGN